MTRPETGPMRFGDDWTGVFLRGDHAFAAAASLSRAIAIVHEAKVDERLNALLLAELQGLLDTLISCNEQRVGFDRSKTQYAVLVREAQP